MRQSGNDSADRETPPLRQEDSSPYGNSAESPDGYEPTIQMSVVAPNPPSPPDTVPPVQRLVSLDMFRGMTVFGMLLVNNIALDTATPKQLLHAEWSGAVHFADLVFPWFLLIVGVSLPFSLASFRRKERRVGPWLYKAMGRTVGLFLLGCLLESVVARHVVIGMSVLQLIGFASFIGALGVLVPAGARVLLSALFLCAYASLLLYFPTAEETGRFTEAGNAIRVLHDSLLEPIGLKGVLSIIPAGGMTLLGSVFGDLIRRPERTDGQRLTGMFVGGTAIALTGYLWQNALPFNKPLWTPSYILYTGGLGLMLLGFLYLLLDHPVWRGRTRFLAFPLTVFGSNAILAYAAPIIFRELALRQIPISPTQTADQALRDLLYGQLGRWNGGWAYTVLYIGVWWIVLLIFHRRRWYVRL
ncbi:MAG: heparan-alpha-glucosaminide N-acetyltransferase domain-containing protein [Capsulimonadales bacterium]|nr:heparan-alpha-glucosaminide N-acetyltransferase domain-containing protein [Capsulimonadales bacterium]